MSDKPSASVYSQIGHIAVLEAAIQRLKSEILELKASRDAYAAEWVREALKYAHHKNNCKGFPAISEEQLARDCDCGLAQLEREKDVEK